jgi:NTE family protein
VVRLAFSGSGFLAGIHAGAAAAVLESGRQIAEVAGTSGGSIAAAAVSLGFTSDELHNFATSDMSSLLDLDISALFGGNYCNGDNLHDWLDSQFHGATLASATIPTQIIATNVKAKAPFIFTREQFPTTTFATACRASSAVPFVYAPVIIDDIWLADGGMVANCPVDRLIVDSALRIGVDVFSSSTVSTSPPWAYAGSLVELLLSSAENTEIRLGEATGATVLKVPTNEFFLNTELTVDQKQALFDSGYNAVKKFLSENP